jgi:peptidyl-prolyl cis-trans isomerase C
MLSNKKIWLTSIFCLLIIIFISGCKNSEPAIASVGASKLTKKELSIQIPQGAQLTKENVSTLIEKWINTELLYQEAKKQKLDKDETLQVQLKQLEKEMFVNKLLEKEMANITVSRQEIFDYFTKHKDEFLYEIKMSRIVLSDESLANQVLLQLKSGADFKKLAEDVSQDRVLAGGAESKYFSRGVGDPRAGGDPTLEEEIFKLNTGEISGVIKSQEGYQIVKLIDKQKVKKDISLSEVEEYINSIIQYKKSREMLDTIITNLKAKTRIVENPEVFFSK